MNIQTPRDVMIIVRESDEYIIQKNGYCDLHVVTIKSTGRVHGLLSEEDAILFAQQRLYEEADDRKKARWTHLYVNNGRQVP